MKNTIKVIIDGRDYNMVAVEDETYVRRCAELVDQQIKEVSVGGRLSQADAAVLAAMNVADMLLKEQEASENLRRQVKENLEEANALKMELSEAKREIFKLGTKK
ncbi:MAG: cell division protein ZapA [Lawsonibacter sp.]|jgi:cell division protein ZapA|nr:cell division protein ZapA [Lawsonibacter sp.]